MSDDDDNEEVTELLQAMNHLSGLIIKQQSDGKTT